MTAINYPDIVRLSPDGKLRLEIRSPDNDPISPRVDLENTMRQGWGGFQRDFTLIVKRVADNEVFWQRTPNDNDRCQGPNEAWVGDHGHVIVITRSTFSSDLILISPTGQIVRVYTCDELLEGNPEEICGTSAGPSWNERGMGHFLDVESDRYWNFRTQMNRQILIDLDHGILVTVAGTVEQAVRKAQRQLALGLLSEAVHDSRLEGNGDNPEDWQFYDNTWSAAFWCGLDRVEEAVPLLRELEKSKTIGRGTFGWKARDGKRLYIACLWLVPVAQFALRRLNQEPAGFAPFWLYKRGDGFGQDRIDVPELLPDRPRRLREIRVGMTLQQMVDYVGMPDAIKRPWEYDVLSGDDESHTLLIESSNESDAVVAIDRIQPRWEDWKRRVNRM